MGYTGKLQEKQTAIKLRQKGISYRQIVKEVKVSKDTVSRWCRDIKLTPRQIEKLIQNKANGLRKGSIIGAKVNQAKRIKDEKVLMQQGITEIGTVSKRERFLIGVSLYMAEGSKTGSGIEFTNSDPSAIKFMFNWFQEFCQINKENIRCSLWLHDNLNEHYAIKFWSDFLKISPKQFGKTYLAKSKSNQIRKQIHHYGIIKIRFYNIHKLRLIKGWIAGILSA